MPASPALASVLHQPFAEQVAFFRQKLNLPTERWDDLHQAAHDRAFVVAQAMKADLLVDLRAAVDKAIAQGTTLETFRRDFREIVKTHGWTGWTGEGTEGGEAWRTRVIFETNLRTSYAAGRWQQLHDPALLAVRPYWRYVHSDLVRNARPLHKHWGDTRLTLPHDHPFWLTHYPPNGWGCRCRVVPVRAPAEGDATEPPAGWDAVADGSKAPAGIDEGWAYAPGANVGTPLLDLVGQKLFKLEAPIGAVMWRELGVAIRAERATAYRHWLSSIDTDKQAKSVRPVVGAIAPQDLAWLQAHDKPTPATAEIVISSAPINGPKAIRHQAKGDAITTQVWEQLPEMLDEPLAVLYDTRRGTLLYVLAEASIRRPQLTVEFSYLRRDEKQGAPNQIISGYRPALQDLQARVRSGGLIVMRGSLEQE